MRYAISRPGRDPALPEKHDERSPSGSPAFARRVPVEIEETGEYRAIQACAPAPRVTLSPRRGERP